MRSLLYLAVGMTGSIRDIRCWPGEDPGSRRSNASILYGAIGERPCSGSRVSRGLGIPALEQHPDGARQVADRIARLEAGGLVGEGRLPR
jgi:hypothetical protein